MPINRFSAYAPGINAPAIAAYAVTPSNTADLPEVIRQVTISGAGVIRYIGPCGGTFTTGVLPAGTYVMTASRILATGTTATGITGWA